MLESIKNMSMTEIEKITRFHSFRSVWQTVMRKLVSTLGLLLWRNSFVVELDGCLICIIETIKCAHFSAESLDWRPRLKHLKACSYIVHSCCLAHRDFRPCHILWAKLVSTGLTGFVALQILCSPTFWNFSHGNVVRFYPLILIYEVNCCVIWICNVTNPAKPPLGSVLGNFCIM